MQSPDANTYIPLFGYETITMFIKLPSWFQFCFKIRKQQTNAFI